MIDYFNHSYEQKFLRLDDFKVENDDVYTLALDLYSLSKWLVDASLLCEFNHFIEQELVQKVDTFFHHALLLTMSEQPQLGIASARIAIETGRDLLRILESHENRELFLCTVPTKEQIKQYRKVFRFQQNEKHLLEIYNFASNYGIHSKTQVTDSVSAVLNFAGKNFKVSRQKHHSRDASKILIVAQYLLTDLIWQKLAKLRQVSGSPELGVFVDLFENKQIEILPQLLAMPEFKQLKL